LNIKKKYLTQRRLWSNPTWWFTWKFKTDASQHRLRHKTTLWKHHNVGWSLLTHVVMHLFWILRCITTSVKRLQPMLWCFHNVVLCL